MINCNSLFDFAYLSGKESASGEDSSGIEPASGMESSSGVGMFWLFLTNLIWLFSEFKAAS